MSFLLQSSGLRKETLSSSWKELRKMRFHFPRSKYGSTFTRLRVLFNTCTGKGLCIVIWNQPTFLLIMMVIWKSVILVYQDNWVLKHLRRSREWEHLSTWVLRFSREKATIGNQMSGVWGVLLMSLVLWEVHLGPLTKRTSIFTSCSRGYLKEIFLHLLSDTVKNFVHWLWECLKLTLIKGSISTKFVSYVRPTKSIWQTNPRSTLTSSWMTLLKSLVFWITKTNFAEGGSINEWVEYTSRTLLGLTKMKPHEFIWCTIWYTGLWVSTKNK